MQEIEDLPAPTPTETVELGRTGLYVSPVGTGCWAWGDRLLWNYGQDYGEGEVEGAFRASLTAGINFFDTAELYGRGQSERLLGRFAREVPRQTVTITTKFLPLPWRFRRGDLVRALRSSLERLQLAQVDLYQIHWPLPPVTAWVSALAEAAEAGLTRTVGVSNYNASQTRQAAAVLAARGLPLASNQVEYSLLERRIEQNGVLDACRERGVSIIAYSPLAKGLLTGKYTPDNPPPGPRSRMYNRAYLERIAPVLATLAEIAAARGKTQAQVALNWLVCQGAIPIPGAKNARQAADNAGALGWRLDSGEVDALSKASARVAKR